MLVGVNLLISVVGINNCKPGQILGKIRRRLEDGISSVQSVLNNLGFV